jgi:serine/threonine protein kinase
MQNFQLSPDTVLGGRYAIAQSLGSGGFGQTYLAHDRQLPGQPTCVVKQLKPQQTDAATLQVARRLFETEAEVLYKLGSHDQIPRLFAHFEEQQEFFLVQEFIEGHSLETELMMGQPWSEPQVVDLLTELLDVLAFVHQANVIHRDLKPANILRRDRDGKLVLIDFGAVKQISTGGLAEPTHLTIAIGTPRYMPTEQSHGKPRFTSDIYAIGMIGIQALTGLPPYALSEDQSTSEWVWQDRAIASPQLKAVLERMVKYDFRQRYESAESALQALSALYTPIADTIAAVEPAPQPADFKSVETVVTPAAPKPAKLGLMPQGLLMLTGIGATLAIGWGLWQMLPKPSPQISSEVSSSTSPPPVQGGATAVNPAPLNPPPVTTNPSPGWQSLGAGSTGEAIALDTASIVRAGQTAQFTYRIGTETLNAEADCSTQRWKAGRYDWVPPTSAATEKMLAIVCGT